VKLVLCFTVCDRIWEEKGEGWDKHGSKFVGGADSGTECDTKTPGCELGCINDLWPLGKLHYIRLILEPKLDYTVAPKQFWLLEILAIMVPMIIFVVYASHYEHRVLLLLEEHVQNQTSVMKERDTEDSNSRNKRLSQFYNYYRAMVNNKLCLNYIIYSIYTVYYCL